MSSAMVRSSTPVSTLVTAAAVVVVVLGVVVVAVAADDASRRVASVRTVLVLPAMPWPMVTALADSDFSEALLSCR